MIIEFDMDQEIVPIKKEKTKKKQADNREMDRLDLPLQEHEWIVPKTK